MKVLNIWKALLATVVYIVVLELLGMIILITLIFPESIDLETTFLISSSLYCLGSLSMLITVYFVLRKYIFEKSEKVQMSFPNILLYGITTIILGYFIVFIQSYIRSAFGIIPGFEVPENITSELQNLKTWEIPILFSSIIVLPLSEELFFRGFILKGLLKKHGILLSLLISSLLFAAIHFGWYSMNIISLKLVFITFIGGLIAGALFIKTERIIYPILFHITWNLIANLSDYIAIPV